MSDSIKMTKVKGGINLFVPDAMIEPKAYSYVSERGKNKGRTMEGTKYFDNSRFGVCQVGTTNTGDPIIFGGFLKSIKGGLGTSNGGKAVALDF